MIKLYIYYSRIKSYFTYRVIVLDFIHRNAALININKILFFIGQLLNGYYLCNYPCSFKPRSKTQYQIIRIGFANYFYCSYFFISMVFICIIQIFRERGCLFNIQFLQFFIRMSGQFLIVKLLLPNGISFILSLHSSMWLDLLRFILYLPQKNLSI